MRENRVVHAEVDPVDTLPPGRGRPLDPDEEDRLVARLLKLAAASTDGIELADQARVEPLRSLAAARGVPLEEVLRASLRGDLRDIVALPAVEKRGPPR